MSFPPRFGCILSGIALTLCLALQGPGSVGGTPSANTPASVADDAACGDKGKEDAKNRTFAGLPDCRDCHVKGTKNEVTVIRGIKVNLNKERWVHYTEFQEWEKDKHAQAYDVLLNERSKKMGQILKTEVHRDKRCLACHTGYPVNQMEPDPDDATGHLAAKSIQEKLDVTFGVTCEGCHGPSKGPKEAPGWYGPHQEPDTWRFMTPKDKLAGYGFWDVRSPASRTRICASCHIGNAEMGRVLTHEMYAAGHPPLPAFEIESFIKQMPPHWTPFAKKSKEVIERFLKNTKDPLYQDYREEDLHRTQAMLVGELVSASEYYRLIGDLTADKARAASGWPELATFDCYACHHELKGPTWRQARKPPAGIPGRPFLQEWNGVLVKNALSHLGDAPKHYDTRFEAIRQALNKQPFGERAALKKSTQDMAQWLLDKARELEGKSLPPEMGRDVFTRIADTGSSQVHDYDSARKLVWALDVVSSESAKLAKKDIAAHFTLDGKEMFLLDLVKGREVKVRLPGDDQARPIKEVELEKVMPFYAQYDPLRFREAMLEIKKR